MRDRDGRLPTVCDTCNQHQGQLPEKRVARAEAHEAMIRERLDRCRKSEALATERAKRAGAATASALASRGTLASRLHEAAARLGRHNCDATRLGLEPQVIQWAERHQREVEGRTGYADWDED